MENSTFKFRISFVWYSDVDLWIEIPMELYQKICNSVGSNKMERYEFCFKFSDIIKEKSIKRLINGRVNTMVSIYQMRCCIAMGSHHLGLRNYDDI